MSWVATKTRKSEDSKNLVQLAPRTKLEYARIVSSTSHKHGSYMQATAAGCWRCCMEVTAWASWFRSCSRRKRKRWHISWPSEKERHRSSSSSSNLAAAANGEKAKGMIPKQVNKGQLRLVTCNLSWLLYCMTNNHFLLLMTEFSWVLFSAEDAGLGCKLLMYSYV